MTIEEHVAALPEFMQRRMARLALYGVQFIFRETHVPTGGWVDHWRTQRPNRTHEVTHSSLKRAIEREWRELIEDDEFATGAFEADVLPPQ